MNEQLLEVKNMYDLTHTMAEPLLSSVTYPWEVLPKLGDFIRQLGPTLGPE